MQSDRILTAGLIDYAGLFPPAQLGMDQAVRNYAQYLDRPESELLGRFVLPVARLREFEDAAGTLLPRGPGGAAWRLAVLLTEDFGNEIASILKFNCSHWDESPSGHAIVDVVEMRADDVSTIERLKASLPDFYRAFIELPITARLGDLLDATRAAGFSAKIRTGGIERSAFPTPEDIVTFMEACRDRGIPFKATAGLHHIVCNSYPLTYAVDSPSAPMFGFLNVFTAAVFLFLGAPRSDVHAILEETNPRSFVFGDQGMTWRTLTATNADIRRARTEFAISFGSCSFTEPVDELAGILTPVLSA